MNWLSNYRSPITIFATFLFANVFISFTEIPSYGSWTGIRPIEDKLKKLEEFSKMGPVDAIVLGASITDFGFSAELYSNLMSKELGRPFRVFNFSTGGAEMMTMPSLYRIARSAVKPKAIFVSVPVEFKRAEGVHPNSPDFTLRQAPIGAALNSSVQLQFSKFIWSLPIVEKSAALRDLLLHGRYKNLVGQGMDTFSVSAYGDRISYLAGQESLVNMRRIRREYEEWLKPSSDGSAEGFATTQKTYFPDTDIKGMADLKKLALDDRIEIFVLAHASAGVVWLTPSENSGYRRARSQYFDVLAKSLEGTLFNPLEEFSLPDYAMMEATHLNTYGAEIYTDAVFRSAIGSGNLSHPRITEVEQVSLEPIRSKEVTFNTWSSILVREGGRRHKSLKARFMKNFAVPALPKSDLFFGLRMPDGADIITPVRLLKSGEYEADVVLERSARKQTLILRLLYGPTRVPLNAPLASYSWISSP